MTILLRYGSHNHMTWVGHTMTLGRPLDVNTHAPWMQDGIVQILPCRLVTYQTTLGVHILFKHSLFFF